MNNLFGMDDEELQPMEPDYKALALQSVKEKYGLSQPPMEDPEAEAGMSGPNWQAGIGALAAGLQGRDSVAAGQSIIRNQQSAQDQENQARRALVESYMKEKMAKEKSVADLDKEKREQDFKMAMLGAQKQDRQAVAQDRAEIKNAALEEKQQALKTPYGLANTADDAKQLKEAHESKQSFDSKIQEMIDLRKEFGGEVANREAVARGKQLSKDLLLQYKNMAKLGVLSKSDEDIVNAIIPEDPLAFSASSLVGQDPILYQLQKFKEDSGKDFATRVGTRTRSGLAGERTSTSMSSPQASQMIKMIAPNGSTKMVPSDKVEAAIKAGGKLAN